MGDFGVEPIRTSRERRRFYRAIMDDIELLDQMIRDNRFESGIQRIGAEQEICTIDIAGNPWTGGFDLLPEINMRQYTNELAKFNLEINLDPEILTGACFSNLNSKLNAFLEHGRGIAQSHGGEFFLGGILPTLQKKHLSFDQMTPLKRYKSISETLLKLRGKDFQICLQGVDELDTTLSSVLFEACNTSFQLHLQIEPDRFIDQYNWSQMIAGPVLSAGTNSPLLFGKELWHETRIALFKQSLDARNFSNHIRTRVPRVDFGTNWMFHSFSDVFKEHLTRFPLLLQIPGKYKSQRENEVPSLRAMLVHNGTTYRWNRPCYGTDGKVPHMRIECRYLPAGPSVLDQMANFTFWVGLMLAEPADWNARWPTMDFRIVIDNFIRAARHGIHTCFDWFGSSRSARDIILNDLVPMARTGLRKAHIDTSDINRYLNIIEKRVDQRMTGSTWSVKSFRNLCRHYSKADALNILTRQSHQNQWSLNTAVHEWPIMQPNTYVGTGMQSTVRSRMTTELITVKEDDPVSLVLQFFKWHNINHVFVEDDHYNLIGIISSSDTKKWKKKNEDNLVIKDLMTPDPITCRTDTPVDEALDIMKLNGFRSLPVLEEGQFVGVVTINDLEPSKIRY